MAYIELVIKIPEEMYKWVNDVNKFFDDYGTSDFIDLVKNGTPLPKGHGRLIDADAIPLSVIEDIKAEIVKVINVYEGSCDQDLGVKWGFEGALEIIDEKVKEYTDDM